MNSNNEKESLNNFVSGYLIGNLSNMNKPENGRTNMQNTNKSSLISNKSLKNSNIENTSTTAGALVNSFRSNKENQSSMYTNLNGTNHSTNHTHHWHDESNSGWTSTGVMSDRSSVYSIDDGVSNENNR